MTSQEMIKSFVERVERVNEEIKGLNDDKRDIFTEAKSQGFDTKALKIVIQRRAKDPDELTELEAVVETYEAALGTGHALRARAGATVAAETKPAPIDRTPILSVIASDDLDIPPDLDRRRQRETAS